MEQNLTASTCDSEFCTIRPARGTGNEAVNTINGPDTMGRTGFDLAAAFIKAVGAQTTLSSKLEDYKQR